MAAVILLVASSCSSRLMDFTIISTKSLPIGYQPTNFSKAPIKVKGVDKVHFFLFIPLGSPPDLKKAIDNAIEQYPGAVALADGVVKSEFMDFFFYGQSGYIVEGTPLYLTDDQKTTINSQNQSASKSAPDTSYMRITHQVNKEKNVTELAKMYDVSVSEIIRWNKLSTPALKEGQEIIIYLPR